MIDCEELREYLFEECLGGFFIGGFGEGLIEISDIEIENYMPEELKNAIKRYNEIHKRTIDDLMVKDEENDDNKDNNLEESDIIEDNNNNLDLKNIF